MGRDQTLQSLRNELERIQQSIEILSSLPEVNLSELYVAKKCAAEFLGISYRTIERWHRQGDIECVRIGGRVYFLKTELLRVLSGKGPKTLSELLTSLGVRQ